MNLHQLKIYMEEMTEGLRHYARNVAPHDIGEEAVEFFKESFQDDKKGFTNTSLTRWPQLKRPNHKNGRSNILVKSGNLRRSIEADVETGKVTIRAEAFSNKGFNYASVHNFGNGNIPQRQFVGESEILNQKIMERLKKKAVEITRKG